MIGSYLLATGALRNGRSVFSSSERAVIEFERYRCFLLGLPEELVPSTPEDIVAMFHGRAATLRDGFDEDCRRLVSSTMDAYLRPTHSAFDRIADAVERSYSKLAFAKVFCDGDLRLAAGMGVDVGPDDWLRAAITAPFIAGRVLAVAAAVRQPLLRPQVDRYLVDQVKHRLKNYGVPAYTTDVREYVH